MITIKANRTNLNKILKWSSSRFNEFTKTQVISKIIDAVNNGVNYEYHFGTGAFSERNCWGWGYDLKIVNGVATLQHDITKDTYLLIKS